MSLEYCYPITDRQKEALILFAKGLEAKEVAKALGIALSTANQLRRMGMRKLGLSSRAKVTLWAVKEGLI